MPCPLLPETVLLRDFREPKPSKSMPVTLLPVKVDPEMSKLAPAKPFQKMPRAAGTGDHDGARSRAVVGQTDRVDQ
jgi:hypothetical protein